MYTHNSIQDQLTGARNVIIYPIERYGISVFVDSDPDNVAPDFVIDPADEKGIELFREFAKKMYAHFLTLKK